MTTGKKILGLLCVNILWLVCCIPVITAGASTCAAFAVTLRLADDDEEVSSVRGVLQRFFKAFRQDLLQGFLIFVFTLVCAGLGGIITAAKTGAADANTLGNLAELDAIAAVAVGGTSMSGGRAKVFGTVIGALIMQLINITVNMNNITYEYAQILKAIIIVLAVYIQREKNS